MSLCVRYRALRTCACSSSKLCLVGAFAQSVHLSSAALICHCVYWTRQPRHAHSSEDNLCSPRMMQAKYSTSVFAFMMCHVAPVCEQQQHDSSG